jgi:F-type H+-transporting ATPase subunit delta
MNQSAITVRYAKALYQVGEEMNKTEAIMSSIELLTETINEAPEFSELLGSPIIKTSEKVRLFNEIFSGKLNETVINFFGLLAQNKREQYLPEMCYNYHQYYKQEKGIKEAVLTTAQPLDVKYKEEILQLLKKKFKLNIELNDQVNEELIGGFRLRIDDQQIDASIASKLKKIKKELINS